MTREDIHDVIARFSRTPGRNGKGLRDRFNLFDRQGMGNGIRGRKGNGRGSDRSRRAASAKGPLRQPDACVDELAAHQSSRFMDCIRQPLVAVDKRIVIQTGLMRPVVGLRHEIDRADNDQGCSAPCPLPVVPDRDLADVSIFVGESVEHGGKEDAVLQLYRTDPSR